jgi:hypothetical protein
MWNVLVLSFQAARCKIAYIYINEFNMDLCLNGSYQKDSEVAVCRLGCSNLIQGPIFVAFIPRTLKVLPSGHTILLGIVWLLKPLVS